MTDTPANRLFILDGMALAFRAHYAFFANPIKNSQGQVTSAVYGFANTLLSILENEKPTHIVACFDTSTPTARHKLYPDYKANRESMPEDLKAQMPLIFQFLECMNIPILRYPGYEADDTIGTLTRLADESGNFASFMVSQDKDLGQLISPTCYLWKPGKKGADHEVIDLPALLSNWEIQNPAQIIDILALMGDSADNIPGVPGIGEKTAKLLISQFGSVENLIANSAELKGKRRQTIEENSDKAHLSKQLATIDRFVPIKETLSDFSQKPPHADELKKLLQLLEFRTMMARIFGKESAPQAPAPLPADDLFAQLSPAPTPTSSPQPESPQEVAQLELFAAQPLRSVEDVAHEYICVDSEEKLAAMITSLQGLDSWCFDTETTGLDPLTDSLIGIAFSDKPHHAWYVPVCTDSQPQLIEKLRPLFENSALKIGHNLKFDLQIMRHAGIMVQGPFYDTFLAHALIAPGMKHSMDALAESLLNYTTIKLADIAKVDPNDKSQLLTADVPLEVMARYSAEDADITMQLYQRLQPQLTALGMQELFESVELPLLPVLANMEYEGVHVRPDSLHKASAQVGDIIEGLRSRIEATAGYPININSPKQLGTFLFDELKLVKKAKKTKTGQYVTDEATLSSLEHLHPVIADILAYRENSKLKSTYLDALPEFISPADGRIHTKFMQIMTATGRLASQEPNLQNIPIRTEQGRLIRTAFVPASDEYTLLSADYSQVELRIMAALSGDSALCDAFRQGRDIHRETAARMYGIDRDEVDSDMRRAAKTVNFGIIYGISAFGLSQRLGCSRAEAATLIDNYFNQFPGVKSYMDSLIHDTETHGFAQTLLGRRRYIPDINSANKNIKQAAQRTAINTPIQGTAADMIKLAMIKVAELLKGSRSKLILQIHDELLIDLHKDELHLIPLIKDAMTSALPLPNDVPLLVEAATGANWLEAH